MENITKTTMQVRVLTPEQGFFLTQSVIEDGAERVFSEKVFLAKDANENDWRLATVEEKQEYEQLKQSEYEITQN